MKHLKAITIVCISLGLLGACSPKNQAKKAVTTQEGKAYYGATPMMSATPVQLGEAISKKQFEKKIHLQGSVSKVCQKKGCWMIVQDGEKVARITFKDYGFFVPKDIQGKTVILEGVLTKKTLSEKDARHFAEDEGAPQAAIDAIKGPQFEYAYTAESVVLASKAS